MTPADWLRHAAFLQIYRLNWLRAGLTQTWSLCTEVAFYVLLPGFGLVALAASRRFGWRPAALLGGCGFLVVATELWYVWMHAEGWSVFTPANFWLPGYLSWFAGGMAMAIIDVHLTHRPSASNGRWRMAHVLGASAGSCWVIALGLFLIVATPMGGPRTVGYISTIEAIARNLLYLGLAMLIVWPSVFGNRTWANAVFANRPMRWLGERSYSIFLLHLVVLQGAMNVLGYHIFTGSATAVFVLTMAGTIALSALYLPLRRAAGHVAAATRPAQAARRGRALGVYRRTRWPRARTGTGSAARAIPPHSRRRPNGASQGRPPRAGSSRPRSLPVPDEAPAPNANTAPAARQSAVTPAHAPAPTAPPSSNAAASAATHRPMPPGHAPPGPSGRFRRGRTAAPSRSSSAANRPTSKAVRYQRSGP